MSTPLVTLTMFRRHLNLPTTGDLLNLSDLQAKLDQATAIVLDYLARPSDTAWTATIESWGLGGSPEIPVPPQVQAAILEQAAELYGFRGDDPNPLKRDAPGDLAPAIKAKLYRLRQPVIA